MHEIMMGCVADDFTGAGDLASFLQEAGANCLLINGLPAEGYHPPAEYDAIVIALKTRSVEAAQAVKQSLTGFDWLSRRGARSLYFKYCSTFDSTPDGNIGPVLDALLERYRLPYTILCPSLPVNRRTVRNGILYVEEIPLAESPMKDHPVNPMWDSSIPNLMKAQSRYPAYAVTWDALRDETALTALLQNCVRQSPHFYLVPDYWQERQGERIARLFSALRLSSGGSALPPHLYRAVREGGARGERPGFSGRRGDGGRGLILSGSCSRATRRQITNFLRRGYSGVRMLPAGLMGGSQTVDDIWKSIEARPGEDMLVYSYEDLSAQPNAAGQKEISALLEGTVAELGRRAVESGIKNLVVAGGETSGAVIQRLGVAAFGIGPAVAPGVPILYPQGLDGVQIVLKSGNFGGPDFLTKALGMMKEGVS